jgi:hypothetical protein
VTTLCRAVRVTLLDPCEPDLSDVGLGLFGPGGLNVFEVETFEVGELGGVLHVAEYGLLGLDVDPSDEEVHSGHKEPETEQNLDPERTSVGEEVVGHERVECVTHDGADEQQRNPQYAPQLANRTLLSFDGLAVDGGEVFRTGGLARGDHCGSLQGWCS